MKRIVLFAAAFFSLLCNLCAQEGVTISTLEVVGKSLGGGTHYSYAGATSSLAGYTDCHGISENWSGSSQSICCNSLNIYDCEHNLIGEAPKVNYSDIASYEYVMFLLLHFRKQDSQKQFVFELADGNSSKHFCLRKYASTLILYNIEDGTSTEIEHGIGFGDIMVIQESSNTVSLNLFRNDTHVKYNVSYKAKEEAEDEGIDLGLSVNWAQCNVGANSPEEAGDYYAWGETSTKTSYTRDNCVMWRKSMTDISATSYDAAYVNVGSNWRMPTKEELEELRNNCYWTWTTQNDVNGYLVTSKNGNSIFLPAHGIKMNSELSYDGNEGGYWTSTPLNDVSACAYHFYYGSDGRFDYDYGNFYYGMFIRPVYNKKSSSVASVKSDTSNENVNVYNVNGQIVKQNVSKSAALKGLPKGVYILDGEKYIVK